MKNAAEGSKPSQRRFLLHTGNNGLAKGGCIFMQAADEFDKIEMEQMYV